jgi:hypothetical protein
VHPDARRRHDQEGFTFDESVSLVIEAADQDEKLDVAELERAYQGGQ